MSNPAPSGTASTQAPSASLPLAPVAPAIRVSALVFNGAAEPAAAS